MGELVEEICLENNVHSLLNSIRLELQDYEINEQLYTNIKELLEFYVSNIFNIAVKNVFKKLNRKEKISNSFIKQFDIEDFVKELEEVFGFEKDNKNELIFTIIGKLIQFYKMSQIYAFAILGVKKVEVDMNANTCEVCKERFKNGFEINDDIDETIFHPFCKTVFRGEKNEKIDK